jgi:hypothetical protein
MWRDHKRNASKGGFAVGAEEGGPERRIRARRSHDAWENRDEEICNKWSVAGLQQLMEAIPITVLAREGHLPMRS